MYEFESFESKSGSAPNHTRCHCVHGSVWVSRAWLFDVKCVQYTTNVRPERLAGLTHTRPQSSLTPLNTTSCQDLKSSGLLHTERADVSSSLEGVCS